MLSFIEAIMNARMASMITVVREGTKKLILSNREIQDKDSLTSLHEMAQLQINLPQRHSTTRLRRDFPQGNARELSSTRIAGLRGLPIGIQ